MKRNQTTYTFTSVKTARAFKTWLLVNRGDSEYGFPIYVGERNVGPTPSEQWCVEFSHNAANLTAYGVAVGMEFLALHHATPTPA